MKAENRYINLCDTCANCFAECNAEIEFGEGNGNDNVIECDEYEKEEP